MTFDGRHALDLLTVIADRFDLAAAAAVLDEPDGPGVNTGLVLQSLADEGLVLAQRFGPRVFYGLHRSTRTRSGASPPDGERAQAVRRLGRFLAERFAAAPDDGHWLADVEPLLGTITGAAEDLIPLDPALAARLALIVGLYHRRRLSEATIVDQLALWAGQLPPSPATRVLVGEIVSYFAFTGRLDEARAWCDRHDAMTDVLGYACPRQPTEILRSTLAAANGDLEEAERLCRLVLSGAARGGGPVTPRQAMYAYGNLSGAVGMQGKLDEGEACARRAFELAAELGELGLAADVATNIVHFETVRHGFAPQARNILRWLDSPSHDSARSSSPRIAGPASWAAAELGRRHDAARLTRLVKELPPTNQYFEEGLTPDDLLARLRDVAPQQVQSAYDEPLLSPAEATVLARDILTDPALPPQADPIELGVVALAPALPADALPATVLVGPLRALPPVEQDHLRTIGQVRQYRRGQILWAPTQTSPDVRVVLSGWVGYQTVTLAGEVATVDVAGPGELVGDATALPAALPPATGATALGPVEALVFPSSHLDSLRRRHPAFQEALVELLVARVRRLSGTLADVLYLPVEQRVVRRLIDLAQRASSGPGPVVLAITQDELATMVGSTRPTVNRVLRRIEGDGAVSRSRGRITVLDMAALHGSGSP
ncbi:MAG: Crp/Fnr family transcriptional regulator [Acidimicrobiales bacterium]